MRSSSTRVIHQNLVDLDMDGLDVKLISLSDVNKDPKDLDTIVGRNEGRALGLSAAYSPFGGLRLLAVADATTVVIIDFESDISKDNGRVSPPSDLSAAPSNYLRDLVLQRSTGHVYAFDMAPLALSLWQSHGLRIQQAVDVQCVGSPNSRAPFSTIKFAVGDTARVFKDNVVRAFNDYIFHVPDDPASSQTTTPLAQRAWVTHFISQLSSMEGRLADVPPINMARFSDTLLRFLAKSTIDAFRLEEQRPRETTRTVMATSSRGRGEVTARVDRYQNRIRVGNQQQIRIHVPPTHTVGGYAISASIAAARGEGARLRTEGSLGAGRQTAAITLVGREDPTAAEVKRAQIILFILQGKISTEGESLNPWVHQIYLDPSDDFTWPAEWASALSPVKFNPANTSYPLNSSQVKAVRRMLDESNDYRATIIQGPPGTGKTTVIAAFVQAAVRAGRRGIWLIAQSNIAVKNIAEKLAKFGLGNWKLLVSADFFEFWHEHLYANIRANIIVSDEFADKSALCGQLAGCPVVLCTLSMLSSNALHYSGVFRVVQLQTVVVDEASQIEVGSYIPLFTTTTTIRKVIFIGDDKQLPPHGQEQITALQSIFEVEHLKKHRILLDTQCMYFYSFSDQLYDYCTDRMPPQIGDFISEAVYEDLLKSNGVHPLADTDLPTCHFVNVPGEQLSQGTSWKNLKECQAILKLAQIFQNQGKRFKIITPYDSQRTLIENELKSAEMQWEDKCFNVDSFQGNEEDYIIISLVRSWGLGFLEDLRRTNVMLTRCKRGMVIFTGKEFMRKYGKESLVGQLHGYYEEAWTEIQEMGNTTFI
ncbi:P-loop containing nucleoside triphosphate hydrolase protein [Pisolithus orientalis]|uniref:P-loop containing nucleoside triphosphate hydrolase protein n=1 Tax=Pisolithus orientalis TaxID=936130 RepID=UPI002225A3AC|nr:P-loop containing nucleoside triphosphate hydrolase protein [Pisolithus orientalis]KAI5989422.1 P-loop containing nucleoside triphosphate hydrolase protein [Pisolithus orientalis]